MRLKEPPDINQVVSSRVEEIQPTLTASSVIPIAFGLFALVSISVLSGSKIPYGLFILISLPLRTENLTGEKQ